EALDAGKLMACLAQSGHQLRPVYDPSTLPWLLAQAERLSPRTVQRVLLKTSSGEIAGWDLYFLNTAGASEVIQLHAQPGFAAQVLDHLVHHAWERDAAALTGRLLPDFLKPVSERLCIFQRRPRWMLVHARRPELLDAFKGGAAFFSRLDGEWSQRLF